MKSYKVILTVIIAFSGIAAAQGFDRPSGWDSVRDNDLQVTVFAGQFGGDRVALTKNSDGDDLKISNDDGLIMGLRFGKEVESWGWEISLAGVFADEESESFDTSSSGDASILLADIDFLYYPAGYNFAGSTFRPFLCAGPDVAYYMSDSDYIDDDLMFGYNVGCGIKLGLGEDLPDLRVDYRWHFLGSSDYDDQERTEFSVGLGWKF